MKTFSFKIQARGYGVRKYFSEVLKMNELEVISEEIKKEMNTTNFQRLQHKSALVANYFDGIGKGLQKALEIVEAHIRERD